MKRLLCSILLMALSAVFARAGTCPSGANYINLSSPGASGFFGNVTLGSGNATLSGAITSCFYSDPVAGLDTNTGADEAHPFQYVKGMPNCASNCAAVATSATTGWIIKGGGTYHRSSGSPLMGGTWAVPAFGYVGIDPTWFTGGSFTRPLVSMDNPLSTGLVASCTVADSSNPVIYAATLAASSVTVFDGIEFSGACGSSTNNGGGYVQGGTGNTIERLYLHGWTETTGSLDDTLFGTSGGTSNTWSYLTIDGRDSSEGTVCNSSSCVAGCWNGSGTPTSPCATGFAMNDCTNVMYSIIRHASQGCEGPNMLNWHDNLLEYIFEPQFGGRHGNVVEALSMNSLGVTMRFYNNVIRNVNEGETVNVGGTTQYFFGNICENDQHFPPNPNSFLLEPFSNNSSQVIAVYFYDNTMDGTCASTTFQNSTWASGSTYNAANNHIIGRTSISGGASPFFTCVTGGTNSCSVTDVGGETFMTSATATTQNYLLTNDFSPGNGGGVYSTVGAGLNESSQCSTFSPDSALCSATAKGVIEVACWGGFCPSYPAITVNPRGTTWDSGAFQVSGASTLPVPTLTPGSGTYNNQVSVSPSGSGSGVTYCYTLNGTIPTASVAGTCDSTAGEYSWLNIPYIPIQASATLQVIATKAANTNSSVASATYSLTPLTQTPPLLSYSPPVKVTAASGTLVNGDPTLIVAPNGNILLFYLNCPGGSYDVSPIICSGMLKTSTNHGSSWTDWSNLTNCAGAQPVGCFYSVAGGNNSIYVNGGGVSSTGAIIVFGNNWAQPGFTQAGIWYSRSTNNGATWTAPAYVTAGQAQTYWYNPTSTLISIPAGSPGVTGSCASGCLIIETGGNGGPALLFSFDDGQTWGTAIAMGVNYSTEEMALAWAGGMTLVAFSRPANQAFPTGPVHPGFVISTNMGTSWTVNAGWNAAPASNFTLASCASSPNMQDAVTRPFIVVDPQNSANVTLFTGDRWVCNSPSQSESWYRYTTVNLASLVANNGLNFPAPQILGLYGTNTPNYPSAMPHWGYGYAVPIDANDILLAFESGQGGGSGTGFEDIYTSVLTYYMPQPPAPTVGLFP